MTTEQGFTYFGAQASWGVTKHMGGLKATERLATLCHLGRDTRVLEVGCGVGLTSCYLAAHYGCRVLGVDLSAKMVHWAARRARRKGLQDRVDFQVADAQQLPFDDGSLDAVICESVTVFAHDKEKAVREYVRVTRPGGYVGMNEGTWMQSPVPAELAAYIERTMAGARFLTLQEWKDLLQGAGLRQVVAEPQQMSALRQRLDEMAGLDWQDWLDRLRGIASFVALYARDANFRRYAREITPSMATVRSLFKYLGYGLYVGQK